MCFGAFFSSVSFFFSSAKEGALNATATATAMIVIKMRFIVCHPLIVFEDCAIHRHFRRVCSKLGAGPLKSMSHYIYQTVMYFSDLHLKGWTFGFLWLNG